jgi:hypothetical protein
MKTDLQGKVLAAVRKRLEGLAGNRPPLAVEESATLFR